MAESWNEATVHCSAFVN